jgi:hypothetical protein
VWLCGLTVVVVVEGTGAVVVVVGGRVEVVVGRRVDVVVGCKVEEVVLVVAVDDVVVLVERTVVLGTSDEVLVDEVDDVGVVARVVLVEVDDVGVVGTVVLVWVVVAEPQFEGWTVARVVRIPAAEKAPLRFVRGAALKRACGAQTLPSNRARRENRTVSPATKNWMSQGEEMLAPASGPVIDELLTRRLPPTVTCTGPSARRCAFRDTRRLQTW